MPVLSWSFDAGRERDEPRERTAAPMPSRSAGTDLAVDRARREVSPRPGTSGAGFPGAQPDRLDPQSQSLSRSYGSNLPISLTYILLSTRGCSPRRPDADIGTSEREHP